MGQGGGWGGGRARRGGENGGRPPSAPSLPSLPPLSALLSSQGGGQAPLAPSRGAAGRPPPLCRCGALPMKRKNRQGQNRNRRDQSFVVRESMRLGAPCCPQTAPPVPRGFEPPASQASRQQATGQAARAPVTSCKSATSARDRLQERSARLLTAGFDLRTSIEPRYSRCRQATSARNKLPSARPVC